jgi:IS30 family transposase
VAAPKRKKHPGGRPRAFDDKKRKKAVQLTEKGLSLNGIAKILRVDRTTLDAELKRNNEFREEMLAADGEGELWWLEKIRKCATGTGSRVQLDAAIKFMSRKWPDEYALSKKLESEDKTTTNIQINGDVRISNPDERRAELLGRITALRDRAGIEGNRATIDAPNDSQPAIPQPPAD